MSCKRTLGIFTRIAAVLIAVAMMPQALHAAEVYAGRDGIPAAYKWDLSEIYASLSDFEADFTLVADGLIPQAEAQRGKLTDKSGILLCLNTLSEIQAKLEKMYGYSELSSFTDMASPVYQDMSARVTALLLESGELSLYIDEEIMALDDKTLEGLIAAPELAGHADYLMSLQLQKGSMPDAGDMALIQQLDVLSYAPGDIYKILYNTEMVFDPVTDSAGNVYEVTESGYYSLMSHPDAAVRDAVDESYAGGHREMINTFAALLNAEVEKNVFWSQLWGYDSALEAALDYGVPRSVYDNLIAQVGAGAHENKRYADLMERSEAYFAANPRTDDVSLSYDAACALVMEGLEPLGAEYGALLYKALTSNWVDVYATPGKLSGAQSAQYEGLSHPYILLNYYGGIYDAETLAHELGHGIEGYMAAAGGNLSVQDSDGLVSEVSSAVNEILLINRMIDKAETPREKIRYLNELANLYTGSLFYQTQLAEFELLIHEEAETGGTLDADYLNGLWLSLEDKYFGLDEGEAENLQLGWSSIPHLYMNFYLYSYAACLTAANKIANDILDGKPGAAENYLQFLKSGSTYDPMTKLMNVGIDMTSPEVTAQCIADFGAVLNEMETIMAAEGMLAE